MYFVLKITIVDLIASGASVFHKHIYLSIAGVIVGQYLQNITPNFAAGAELVYQYGAQVPGTQFTVLSAATKITGKISKLL